jgi:hypothetical protein
MKSSGTGPPKGKARLGSALFKLHTEIPTRSRLSMNEQNSAADSQQRRQLELLCSIAQNLTILGDKLDDLATLNQQQTDLLRRVLQRTERAT